MSEKIKKVTNIISTVLVVLVVMLAVFLVGSRVAGFRIFNVISGSMEPEYSVGDLIYVKQVDPTEIKVNDPITFVLNENLVVATHRVVEIDAEKQHFYTKGDANEDVDASPVHFKNVIGVPVFAIPYLGYVSDFVQNPPGMYIAIAVGVLLLIAVFLPDFLGKKEPKAETEPKLPSENMKELEESDSDSAEEKASITITPSEPKQTDEE